MWLITERSLIREVAEAYKSKHYYENRRVWKEPNRKKVYDQLLMLDLNKASYDQVRHILGSDANPFLNMECDDCKARVTRGVIFGHDMWSKMFICFNCIDKTKEFENGIEKATRRL